MQFEQSKRNLSTTVSTFEPTRIAQINGWLGGMDKSDVPYVYHHLRKGCILQLQPINGLHSQHLMYCVNYGSYKLGILNSTMARRIQELNEAGLVFRLTISGIVKEKYLPPTAIELELEWSNTNLGKVA